MAWSEPPSHYQRSFGGLSEGARVLFRGEVWVVGNLVTPERRSANAPDGRRLEGKLRRQTPRGEVKEG
jgi:hypothetical protein